jgi:pimeloyl-ACP methyl ester carboxylesterase
LGLVLVFLLVDVSVATGSLAGPPPASFYRVGRVSHASPGSIVRSVQLRSPGAFLVRVVLYHSRDASGHDVVESGVVAIPSRRAPRGGFPVVSFAHGTTGFTDASAPSRTGNTGSTYSIGDLIDRFLARGWALALTDYHGLGTAGPVPYDVGPDAAHSVLDIVRAARRLAPGKVGSKLAMVGHSVGGHAVLWAGELAHRYAPELRLRAVVASSPGADIAAIGRERTYATGTTLAVLGLLADWHVYYRASLDQLLTQAGKAAAALIYADHPERVDLAQAVFQPGFSTTISPWGALVRSNTPGAKPIAAPTLILVGTADQQIPPDTNIAFAKRLQKRGDDVRLQVIAGADHDQALSRSEPQWLAMLRARLK